MRRIFGPALLAAATLVGTSTASATQRAQAAPTAPRTHVAAPRATAPVRVAPSYNRGGHRGGWHGGRRYGWYGGGWRWGWGWPGWGWGWGWPGYPGYWGAYYGAPYGGYLAYAPGDWGALKTDVSPEEARVLLDGRYIGTADDFDGYPDFLYLKPGKYRLEFQLEGFETQSVDIEARPGVKIEIDNKLKKIPGAKQYGSYDTPEPQGGVQRFFGKAKDQTTAINIEARDGDSGEWRDHNAPGPPPDEEEETLSEPPPADREAPEPPRAERPMPPAPPPVSVPGSKARILFRIEPGDAAIYVDDRFAGTGEELGSLTRGLLVAPGTHKIVVSRPGFSSEATQVNAAAGRSETVEITLERP